MIDKENIHLKEIFETKKMPYLEKKVLKTKVIHVFTLNYFNVSFMFRVVEVVHVTIDKRMQVVDCVPL